MTLNEILKLVGQMLEASTTTLSLFGLTLLIGLPLGLLICWGRMSKLFVVRLPIKFYLLIMRGTPLILQLIFFRFAPYYLIQYSFPLFTAGLIAYSLNYAAYFAEIYRGGLESISKGQYEAASVLGYTKKQTFFKIILPQVIKRIIPPMSNEFMTLVKDTSLVQVIGVGEIYLLANQAMSREFSIIPLIVAGVFYLVMNMVVAKCFSVAEKKLSYY